MPHYALKGLTSVDVTTGLFRNNIFAVQTTSHTIWSQMICSNPSGQELDTY